MDLETFLIELYVLIDDWYKVSVEPNKPKRQGRKPRMSDSEVLTVAIAGNWRAGVPWQSERGVVRWMQRHGKHWFPHMLERSAFNRRVRELWGVFVGLQQMIAEKTESGQAVFECVDTLPLPACTVGQADRSRRHWLWDSGWGRGGNSGKWVFGHRLLGCIRSDGMVTGWLVGSASINDRWLLEAFLTGRSGLEQLTGPLPDKRVSRAQRATLPVLPIGPSLAVGFRSDRPLLADRGFNGPRWTDHWLNHCSTLVLSPPPSHSAARWPAAWSSWLAKHRQPVETAFAFLQSVFDIQHLQAHSRWGLYTRIACCLAAYNFGLWLNRQLGRPQGALATLIC